MWLALRRDYRGRRIGLVLADAVLAWVVASTTSPLLMNYRGRKEGRKQPTNSTLTSPVVSHGLD